MSIRARLTRMLLLAIVPLVVVIGAALFLYVRGALVARFDEGLLTRARALAGMVRVESGRLELDFAGEAMPQFDLPEGREFFEAWAMKGAEAGQVIEKSDSLGNGALEPRVPRGELVVWDAPVPRGGVGRYVALRYMPHPEGEGEEDHRGAVSAGDGPEVLVVVAQSRGDLDRTLALLGWALGGAGLILVGGVLAAVWWCLDRGLAPIGELAQRVEEIRPTDLGKRLQVAGTPRELAPIADRTNRMLDRLEAAFEREKRLAASAAHELRTPIAEMRAVTELALSAERSPGEYRAALGSALESAQRMGAAADAVLRLARVQSGRERPELEAIDLREALAPAWKGRVEPLISRDVRVELAVDAGVVVQADRSMLDVVLDNLCANAAERTPSGGTLRAECRVLEGVEFILTNTTVVEHGADQARANHTGLGLVISREMAEAMEATLTSDVGEGSYRAVLRLPRG